VEKNDDENEDLTSTDLLSIIRAAGSERDSLLALISEFVAECKDQLKEMDKLLAGDEKKEESKEAKLPAAVTAAKEKTEAEAAFWQRKSRGYKIARGRKDSAMTKKSKKCSGDLAHEIEWGMEEYEHVKNEECHMDEDV
jgi:hypothetical protein